MMPMRFTSEQFLKTVTAELQVSVICAGADLTIVDHAPGLAAILQLEMEDLTGWPLERAVPELKEYKGNLVDVALGHLPRFVLPQIERPTPGGSGTRYISVTALPHEQEQCYLVLLVQDSTTEGRLERELVRQLDKLLLLHAQVEAANQELVRLGEERTGLMRMAAHDLRNPLSSIQGCLALVSARGRELLGEECRVLLDIAEDSAKQMGRLIDDLLDIERLESGAMPLRREPVDLAVLVEQVGRSYLPLAKQRGVSLEWSVPAGLPRIQGDWDRLVQVLDNLVSNAIKYTPREAKIRIRVTVSGASVSVEVRDTGFGISEDDQRLLFQRFFRSADPRLREVPGTGLGLSIVQAIVEQHGGEVTCHSRLDEGSTFGFSLPLAPSRIYESLDAASHSGA